MLDVLLDQLLMQIGPTMLPFLNLKGRVSMDVGSDSYTQLHLAQQTLGAKSVPGNVPGGHQKNLGDLSSIEGAGEVHKV